MTISNEQQPYANENSDIDFEEKRLAATVAEAAEKLDASQLKKALNRGLDQAGTHLVVDDEPVSALLDENGDPKTGRITKLTREQIIGTSRREMARRVLRARGIISPTPHSRRPKPD